MPHSGQCSIRQHLNGPMLVFQLGSLYNAEFDQRFALSAATWCFPQAIAAAYGGQAPNTSICEKGWEAQPAPWPGLGSFGRVSICKILMSTTQWFAKKIKGNRIGKHSS